MDKLINPSFQQGALLLILAGFTAAALAVGGVGGVSWFCATVLHAEL